MVVNRVIANDVLEILRKLYDAHYPIERMRLIDDYGADDERSMAANNSSAFNYRITTGSTKLSAHARGLAVDINPLYNPCRRTVGGKVVVEPRQGRKYLQREAKFPYKIVKGDLCYRPTALKIAISAVSMAICVYSVIFNLSFSSKHKASTSSPDAFDAFSNTLRLTAYFS